MPATAPVTVARDRLKTELTRWPSLYERSRRPYAVGRFWLRRPHDDDYRVFGMFPQRRGVFLDVGANAGMSALSFRIYNKTCPIVSVEPNPFHEADLRFAGRLARPFSYRLWAAGAREDELTLHVPVFRGVPITAEASLLREQVEGSSSLRKRIGDAMDSDELEIVVRRVPVRPLDRLGVDPAFVKLDVQGFEHQALIGMTDTIARARPILLVERPEPDVDALLSEWGYGPHELDGDRLVAGPSDRTNTVYLPS